MTQWANLRRLAIQEFILLNCGVPRYVQRRKVTRNADVSLVWLLITTKVRLAASIASQPLRILVCFNTP